MWYSVPVPELVISAAADLESLGSALNAAHAAAGSSHYWGAGRRQWGQWRLCRAHR